MTSDPKCTAEVILARKLDVKATDELCAEKAHTYREDGDGTVYEFWDGSRIRTTRHTAELLPKGKRR